MAVSNVSLFCEARLHGELLGICHLLGVGFRSSGGHQTLEPGPDGPAWQREILISQAPPEAARQLLWFSRNVGRLLVVRPLEWPNKRVGFRADMFEAQQRAALYLLQARGTIKPRKCPIRLSGQRLPPTRGRRKARCFPHVSSVLLSRTGNKCTRACTRRMSDRNVPGTRSF